MTALPRCARATPMSGNFSKKRWKLKNGTKMSLNILNIFILKFQKKTAFWN